MPKPHKPDPYSLSDSGKAGAAATSPAGAGQAAGASSDRFAVHESGRAHVITFSRSDVLDQNYIEQLGIDLKAFAGTIGKPRLVLDLEPVRFMSSSALGMLLELRAAAQSRGGDIALANVQPDIRQVFTITKLDKVLKIHDSTDRAVKAVGK